MAYLVESCPSCGDKTQTLTQDEPGEDCLANEEATQYNQGAKTACECGQRLVAKVVN